jgi:hypothetical protein
MCIAKTYTVQLRECQLMNLKNESSSKALIYIKPRIHDNAYRFDLRESLIHLRRHVQKIIAHRAVRLPIQIEVVQQYRFFAVGKRRQVRHRLKRVIV